MARILVCLQVEDDQDDVFLMRHALAETGFQIRLQVTADGDEAREYLLGKGDYHDRVRHPLPDFVVCDLRMPRLDGIEFVSWLRAQPELASVPVFMFSTSNLPQDISRAIAVGVTQYFVKPISLDAWLKTVREIWQAAGASLETDAHLPG